MSYCVFHHRQQRGESVADFLGHTCHTRALATTTFRFKNTLDVRGIPRTLHCRSSEQWKRKPNH